MRMHDILFLFKLIISFVLSLQNQPDSIMWYYHTVHF